MKIGIVCYPTFGGSGVLATELGKGLARKGHKVHFITYKQPARLTTFDANIYFHEVSNNTEYPLFEYAPYDTALVSKLVDVIQYEKLDILHVHYAIPHATVAYLAKKILLSQGIYIPVVTTLHGTDITLVGINKSFASSVQFAINKSDGVTAVSESLKSQTLEYFDINNNIEVIHNFVDFNRFKKRNKDHFKKAIAPEGEKILVHTSNFRPVKRVGDVIKVFQKVREKVASKLLLIGDGPERQNMEFLCRQLGLCEDIRFLGKQDAVEELLAVGDVFLMPSEKESFGLAALEAMACEVPVVSSDAGGLQEVNIHGKTGFVSPIGDVDDMAKNIIKMLTDEKIHEELKSNALLQAQKFDLDIILPKYESFYQSIIESKVWKNVT